MKKRKVNKSQAIRDYYDDHPDAKPLDVVQALSAKGISVKPHVVSTTRYNMRKQAEAGARLARRRRLPQRNPASARRPPHRPPVWACQTF